MSTSDLKHIERPDWVDPASGEPTLMLFCVVDDRSGVAYQEYRCLYGEDAESALRFLFNAIAPFLIRLPCIFSIDGFLLYSVKQISFYSNFPHIFQSINAFIRNENRLLSGIFGISGSLLNPIEYFC